MNDWKSYGIMFYMSLSILFLCCETDKNKIENLPIYYPSNVLNYEGTPQSSKDRTSLAFSDQGAWFAYGLPSDPNYYGGFSGPFLMTQDNGVWCSKNLSTLHLEDAKSNHKFDFNKFEVEQNSYNSHLEQKLTNGDIRIKQVLAFNSAHSALIITTITNTSSEALLINAQWSGEIITDGFDLTNENDKILLKSERSPAQAYISVHQDTATAIEINNKAYKISIDNIELKTKESKTLLLSHSFIFPEYNLEEEAKQLAEIVSKHSDLIDKRKHQKKKQLQQLYEKLDTHWKTENYKDLIAKSHLTLQNNWRIPAGELSHAGLFPSYHYEWFHGFWAWDSWKHAVALAHVNPELAKDQIRAMFDFMSDDGFIADCVYRDTTIENHNFRNTKPPLSAWAIWKTFEIHNDLDFIKEMYPKVIKQHKWWYINRDHDGDGICEYGSTDGSLIAAKWESGMDNAVRFDSSQILKNSAGAYSLNQESVDLNAYLYADKIYITKMAETLELQADKDLYINQAELLKEKIKNQFYNQESGWFFDTDISGTQFIKRFGCEAWIPLWANIATSTQAEAVKDKMMDANYFNTKVPFQTLSSFDSDFTPDRGYWRGPVWLDQAYFGVKGLQNYGFHQEAFEATYKLIHNAEGVLMKGPSIRENYHPLTGQGMESENFSWSAAHYILLLLKDQND